MTAPGRSELLDLYRVALDEYRFQVNLNWQRSQYYLTFNSALVAVGAGLLQALQGRANIVDAFLFLIGVFSSGFAILATYVQQGYYRATRDGKKRLEQELGLEEFAIRTTPGMGARLKRFGTVERYNRLLLGGLIAANVAGLVLSLIRIVSAGTPAAPTPMLAGLLR